MSQNGKGKGPEKGRDLGKFRSNYDNIDWSKGKTIKADIYVAEVKSIESIEASIESSKTLGDGVQ